MSSPPFPAFPPPPARVINNQPRSVRAIYKTYVDIVHIRKLDKNSRLRPDDGEADPTDRDSHAVHFEEDNELEA